MFPGYVSRVCFQGMLPDAHVVDCRTPLRSVFRKEFLSKAKTVLSLWLFGKHNGSLRIVSYIRQPQGKRCQHYLFNCAQYSQSTVCKVWKNIIVRHEYQFIENVSEGLSPHSQPLALTRKPFCSLSLSVWYGSIVDLFVKARVDRNSIAQVGQLINHLRDLIWIERLQR